MLVDDSIGLPSSTRLDLSERVDGNTALSFGSEYFLLRYYVLNINEVGGINEMLIKVSFQLISIVRGRC